MHSRREPSRNTFRYRVSYFLLDLDELPRIERRLALVSHNRRTLSPFAIATIWTATERR